MFGLTAEEVESTRKAYNPAAVIENDDNLKGVLQLLQERHFNMFEPGLFDPVINSITSPYDPWLTAADFASYVKAQDDVATAYRDKELWTRMSIMNSAKSGRFSTDRTIAEYNDDIWRLATIPALEIR
jgi:starch phosphorylase